MSNEEKRINKKAMDYWESIKDGDDIPLENSLNPDDLDDIWDSCFMIDIKGTTENPIFKYSYLGESLIEAHGLEEEAGSDIYESLVDTHDPKVILLLKDVIANRHPITQESEFTNEIGVNIKFRRCFLPLKEKNGIINYVFGGMRWRAC